MKILRVITRMNVGGPSRQVAALNHAFSKQGHECLLIKGQLAPGEGDMSHLAEGSPVLECDALCQAPHPLKDFKAFWFLWKTMRRFKPDVVHTHHAKAGLLGRFAAWLTGVPVVLHTFHGNVFQGHYSPFLSRLWVLFERMAAHISQHLIAISPQQKKDLSQRFKVAPEHKISVVPLGFQLNPYFNIARDQEAPASKTSILFVGRFTPVKDHLFFVKCLARLKDHQSFQVLFVGSGLLLEHIKNQVHSEGLSDRVSFLGEQSDMVSVYKEARFIACTSRSEGTPAVLIEGMAAGCLPVAVPVGGIPDLLADQRGFLSHERTVESFTSCLDQALRSSEDEIKMMEDRARDYCRRTHRIEDLTEKIEDLYRELKP